MLFAKSKNIESICANVGVPEKEKYSESGDCSEAWESVSPGVSLYSKSGYGLVWGFFSRPTANGL